MLANEAIAEKIPVELDGQQRFAVIQALNLLGAIGWASGTSSSIVARHIVEAIEEAEECHRQAVVSNA